MVIIYAFHQVSAALTSYYFFCFALLTTLWLRKVHVCNVLGEVVRECREHFTYSLVNSTNSYTFGITLYWYYFRHLWRLIHLCQQLLLETQSFTRYVYYILISCDFLYSLIRSLVRCFFSSKTCSKFYVLGIFQTIFFQVCFCWIMRV